MKLHEYQARALFKEYGIPVPEGTVARTPADAVAAAESLGLPVAIKAQAHIGGRGKAGGVKLVDDASGIASATETVLGLTIGGFPVTKVLVTPAVDIEKELYVSLLIDRNARKAVYIGCEEGGIDIETVAKVSPEKIVRREVPAHRLGRLSADSFTEFAERLCDDATQAAELATIMVSIGELFVGTDASLVEINPLIADTAGSLLALDARMVLDDNALFRHPDLFSLRDEELEDPDESRTREAGLSFVRMEGTIGCIVNGAGLAMATMDVIKHLGGAPANFLDIGGGASRDKVVAAFEVILKDPRVKVILVNIFGGITRCDEVARGMVAALDESDVQVPVFIRLTGTNEEDGRAILEGTQLIFAETLEDAAARAVNTGGAA